VPREKVPSSVPAPGRPSLHFGTQHLWANPPYNPADPHNPMIDSKGRVWMTSKIRSNADPSWCNSAGNKYAEWFPLTTSIRQASFYDPKTKQFTLIDTCYSTHHLQFDNDANETLYFNELIGPIFGWVDTKVLDQTKNEQLANGWCGQVLDTNGDGRITKPWNMSRAGNPGLYGGGAAGADAAPLDPKLDTHVTYTLSASSIPATWCGCSAATTRPRAASPRCSRCPSPASIRAAWTSTRTAWCGRRSPRAAIWPASTCASARI
jgi:hypothetical protein